MRKKNQCFHELRMKSLDIINISTKISINSWTRVLLRVNAYTLKRWRESGLFTVILDNPHFWLSKSSRDFHYKYGFNKNLNLWKPTKKYDPIRKKWKRVFKSKGFVDPKKNFFDSTSDKQKYRFIPIERSDINDVHVTDVNIEMINSDFETYWNINQNVLGRILREEYPYLFVEWDPLRYPGVNIKFQTKFGRVDEATGTKSISIMVFRTGKVIITGANSESQVHDAYSFINHVLKKHYHALWTSSDED